MFRQGPGRPATGTRLQVRRHACLPQGNLSTRRQDHAQQHQRWNQNPPGSSRHSFAPCLHSGGRAPIFVRYRQWKYIYRRVPAEPGTAVPKTQIPDDQKRARPRRIRQAIRGPRSGRRLKGPGSTLFRVMKRVAPALVLALGLGWGQHAVGLCQHSQVCGCKRALTTHRFTTSLVASIFARYLAPIQAG